MWVVTKEYNMYDQEGEYFVAAYHEKPDLYQLKKLLKCDRDFAVHVYDGGGRIGVEDWWYNMFYASAGKNYHE